MVEKGPRKDSSIPTPETLRNDRFTGLYGRVLLASSNTTKWMEYVNSEIQIKPKPSVIKKPENRNYNHITHNLSTQERTEAWGTIDFKEAYKQWKEGFKTAIQNTDQERAEVLAKFVLTKNTNEFNDADADRLYEEFCKGKSDTNKFIRNVVERLSEEGKVDVKTARASLEHIEWFSKMLFGKNTADAVSRMIEIEIEIQNNGTENVRKSVFADLNRINKPNLNEDEIRILNNLYKGIESESSSSEQPPSAANAQEATSAESKKTIEEKIPPTTWDAKIARLPKLVEVTGDNFEKYRREGKTVKVNGYEWEILDVEKSGSKENVILERGMTIQEFNKKLEVAKKEGKRLMDTKIRNSYPKKRLVAQQGDWIVEKGFRSSLDPDRIRELEELIRFDQRIQDGEFNDNKFNELQIAIIVANDEKRRLNAEREREQQAQSEPTQEEHVYNPPPVEVTKN